MRRWLLMTGGLLIWAAHFAGVYLISSAADVWSSVDAPASRMLALAFSLACLTAVGGLAFRIRRRTRDLSGHEAWEGRVGLTGALFAAIGVVWQTATLAF